jgi:hypothetical protein
MYPHRTQRRSSHMSRAQRSGRWGGSGTLWYHSFLAAYFTWPQYAPNHHVARRVWRETVTLSNLVCPEQMRRAPEGAWWRVRRLKPRCAERLTRRGPLGAREPPDRE